MKFEPIKTFKKVETDFPNRLVLLQISDPGEDALYDVGEGETIVTMGHWYPTPGHPGQGHWTAVGWNWSQDCFTTNEKVEPISWAEMPKPE